MHRAKIAQQRVRMKGGDRSGLAQGQELTGRKRRTKTSLQERRKTYLIIPAFSWKGQVACGQSSVLVFEWEWCAIDKDLELA